VIPAIHDDDPIDKYVLDAGRILFGFLERRDVFYMRVYNTANSSNAVCPFLRPEPATLDNVKGMDAPEENTEQLQ
jgi:hypothetical protein